MLSLTVTCQICSWSLYQHCVRVWEGDLAELSFGRKWSKILKLPVFLILLIKSFKIHLYFLSGAFLPSPRILLWCLSWFCVLVFDTERCPEVFARCPEVFVFATVGCPEVLVLAVREVSETVRCPGGLPPCPRVWCTDLPQGSRVWCTGLSSPMTGEASWAPPGPATVAMEV